MLTRLGLSGISRGLYGSFAGKVPASPILVTVPKHDLTITRYVPSIDITNNIEVIIPKHDLSSQSYPPSIVISSAVNVVIPKTDINLTSYAPTITTDALFTTASQRIYDYPAVNYTFSYPAINRIYIMKRK